VIPAPADLSAFHDLPFPVAEASRLRRARVLPVEAMGRRLLVLWNGGRPRVYDDSCPHLGMPLSLGKLEGGERLRCRYHGWAFSTDDGHVVEQPTLRKPQPCSLRRWGAMRAGDLVFAWLGDPGEEAAAAARARLPEHVLEGASHFQVVFDCPFWLALFSSVDYAHFPYHTGYKPLYFLYNRLRGNDHRPGSSFPSKLVAEDARRASIRIEDADRSIHVYATATEMDDRGINFFQTFVTPISPLRTLYWESYVPRSPNPALRILARTSFRLVTTRLLSGEDRAWTAAAGPNLARGENIHLSENDVPLGVHLRKFVVPRLKGPAAATGAPSEPAAPA
jgi:nitrite reductase/ring-hydroxylating ferredoxin subunit